MKLSARDLKILEACKEVAFKINAQCSTLDEAVTAYAALNKFKALGIMETLVLFLIQNEWNDRSEKT